VVGWLEGKEEDCEWLAEGSYLIGFAFFFLFVTRSTNRRISLAVGDTLSRWKNTPTLTAISSHNTTKET